jgi:two-component system nitrogen regulation response regulator GlnG
VVGSSIRQPAGRRWTLFGVGKLRNSLDASTAARRGPRHEPTAELAPALTIGAHPDPRRVGDRLVLDRLAAGREILLSRSDPGFLRAGSVRRSPIRS